jgi:hypothetical protein
MVSSSAAFTWSRKLPPGMSCLVTAAVPTVRPRAPAFLTAANRSGEAMLPAEMKSSHQSPPSATVTASPLTPLASSEARKAIVAATSAGATTRLAG